MKEIVNADLISASYGFLWNVVTSGFHSCTYAFYRKVWRVQPEIQQGHGVACILSHLDCLEQRSGGEGGFDCKVLIPLEQISDFLLTSVIDDIENLLSNNKTQKGILNKSELEEVKKYENGEYDEKEEEDENGNKEQRVKTIMNESIGVYQWDNVYPTYPSNSLMVSDATGTNADTDIICENTQKGEVVDKVIYINSSNALVQIKANSYLRDMNFSGLADHMPIVVEFAWEKKTSVKAGIECTVLARGAAADLDASQNLVPSFLGCSLDLLEVRSLHLLEIPPCLFQ